MTKTNFIKSVVQILLVALFIVFVVSMTSMKFTRRIGEMEASVNLVQDNTPKTDREMHDARSVREQQLRSYLEKKILGPGEIWYKVVADNRGMSEWYWDNTTVKAYIMWWTRCVFCPIIGAVALFVQWLMKKHADEEVSHGKTKKTSKSGLKEIFSNAGMLVLEILMVGGVLGALTGRIMLFVVLATVIVFVFELLAYVSNGGKLLTAKKREKKGWKALIPNFIIEAFDINLEEDDDHGIPKNVRRQAGKGKTSGRREPLSLDIYRH